MPDVESGLVYFDAVAQRGDPPVAPNPALVSPEDDIIDRGMATVLD